MSPLVCLSAAMFFMGVAAIAYGLFLRYEVDDMEHGRSDCYVFSGAAVLASDIVLMITSTF